MKQFLKSAIVLVFIASFAVQGSSGDDYYDYSAIYMSRSDLKQSVSYIETGKDVKNPGKIYYKHPYLFINEKYKGVHVFDNTNPVKPVKKGFIMVPGCLDMAVKGDIAYFDNAVDMVSFDLTNMKEVNRIENVFPPLVPPNGYARYDDYDPKELVIVEWSKRLK
jgi:hypothetical protein